MDESSKPSEMPDLLSSARLIREGKLSSVALVELCIKSIKANNQRLNAFGDVYVDAALTEAATMDDEAQRGHFRGPLHGVPFGIKDLFHTAGLRTSRGSLTAVDNVPKEDAPVIRRLKAAGGILLGKTATTEFGWTGASSSRVFGDGRTPWNPDLSSGGSSSGSAIATAARMVPATLGSDGGGSVRIPSSFCGTFALKGSLGRIPTWPWSATEMLSHAGPITRTVRDSALLFDVLSGPDSRDHQALPKFDGSYLKQCDQPLKRLKVAYCPTLFGTQVDPQVSESVEAAVVTLIRGLPIEVEQLNLDWEDPFDIFETLWVAGRGIAYGKTLSERRAELDPGFAKLIEKAKHYDLADYLNATQQRAVFATKVHALFDSYDLLLLPTLPILPFPAHLTAPAAGYGPSDSAVPWARWTPFTYPFNLSGNPAASIPCGWSSEVLPIGLQVVGARHADHEVLQFCAAIEALMPWDHKLPPIAF